MKANELRIGNFVFDDENKPMKVARVETQECTDFNGNDEFNVIIEHIDKNIGYYESKINPIPLTEEWLKKFGFTREEFRGNIGKYRVFKKGLFVYNSNSKWWYNDRQLPNHIKYIHQLQNLYFALTNEELIYTK